MCWHPPQPTWVGSYSGGGFCLRSPSATAAAFSCSQLVAQVLFPCAAAQHDAVPPQENSEVQGHAHSHSKHSDTPRAQAQRPACYYSCSEGGVIKYEAREFFKDLLKSGFITQLPEQQPKLQLPDMSAFDSSG